MLEAAGLFLALLDFLGLTERLKKSLAWFIKAYSDHTTDEALWQLFERLMETPAGYVVLVGFFVPGAVVAYLFLTRSTSSLWLVIPLGSFAILCLYLLGSFAIYCLLKLIYYSLRLVGLLLKAMALPPSGMVGSVGLVIAAISAWERFH